MGLPTNSGTGGHFTLLPNPHMAQRGVPQERWAERRLLQSSNHEDDGAQGNAPVGLPASSLDGGVLLVVGSSLVDSLEFGEER